MSWLLERADTAAFCAGADLLGGGGGGDSDVVEQLLDATLAQAPVRVIDVSELPESALVIHAGALGAPDVVRERHFAPSDLERAIQALARHVGRTPAAIGAIQVGGLNAAAAAIAAGVNGLPLVDGDLMGRAFPRLVHTRPARHGHAPTPLALAGPEGHLGVLGESPQESLDELVAGMAMSMGGAVAIACHAMDARTLNSLGLAGTIRRCLDLGRSYLSGRGDTTDELLSRLGATGVSVARVVAGVEATSSSPGHTTLTRTDDGSVVRLDHIDEFLGVSINGRSVAEVPTVVIALDGHSHRVLHVGELAVGHTVVLAALRPVSDTMLDDAFAVGMDAFGFDGSTP